MPRIAIIKVNEYVQDYYLDNGDQIPQEFMTAWEDVSQEELDLLREESENRRHNRTGLQRFFIVEQETNPRQFVENTVGALLEEVRQAALERAAEEERKREAKRAAAEKKRLAAEAKERKQLEELQRKYGRSHSHSAAAAGEQLSIL